MSDLATVLVVGSGGREHALYWKLNQSPKVGRVLVAPGNGGIPAEQCLAIKDSDIDGLVAAAKEHGADLVVVGPEAPLVAGLVDRLAAEGIAAYGPTAACAQLEGSKAFAKDFMAAAGIPTAAYAVVDNLADAEAYIDSVDHQVVVKASGLAAGKGVLVCDTAEEAKAAAREILEGAFGTAGAKLVIEERLTGPEASLLALCDGTTFRALPPAQDHKRIGEGDTGLNTGGMGAYAPAPVLVDRMEEAAASCIAPVLKRFQSLGTPFKGTLFAGLMLNAKGELRVLEYNCRFGDPETQVVLPLIDGDLYEIMQACVAGELDSVQFGIKPMVASTVVAASGGYPQAYEKGKTIEGVAEADALEGVTVFHAGTKADEGALKTSGGRVMAITGTGSTLREALDKSYAGIDRICFDGMVFRRDIGHRAL